MAPTKGSTNQFNNANFATLCHLVKAEKVPPEMMAKGAIGSNKFIDSMQEWNEADGVTNMWGEAANLSKIDWRKRIRFNYPKAIDAVAKEHCKLVLFEALKTRLIARSATGIVKDAALREFAMKEPAFGTFVSSQTKLNGIVKEAQGWVTEYNQRARLDAKNVPVHAGKTAAKKEKAPEGRSKNKKTIITKKTASKKKSSSDDDEGGKETATESRTKNKASGKKKSSSDDDVVEGANASGATRRGKNKAAPKNKPFKEILDLSSDEIGDDGNQHKTRRLKGHGKKIVEPLVLSSDENEGEDEIKSPDFKQVKFADSVETPSTTDSQLEARNADDMLKASSAKKKLKFRQSLGESQMGNYIKKAIDLADKANSNVGKSLGVIEKGMEQAKELGQQSGVATTACKDIAGMIASTMQEQSNLFDEAVDRETEINMRSRRMKRRKQKMAAAGADVDVKEHDKENRNEAEIDKVLAFVEATATLQEKCDEGVLKEADLHTAEGAANIWGLFEDLKRNEECAAWCPKDIQLFYQTVKKFFENYYYVSTNNAETTTNDDGAV